MERKKGKRAQDRAVRKTERVTLRLPPALLQRLRERADGELTSVSAVITKAVLKYFDLLPQDPGKR
jgi:hypothetical protein